MNEIGPRGRLLLKSSLAIAAAARLAGAAALPASRLAAPDALDGACGLAITEARWAGAPALPEAAVLQEAAT
jgi:hypothetical protein